MNAIPKFLAVGSALALIAFVTAKTANAQAKSDRENCVVMQDCSGQVGRPDLAREQRRWMNDEGRVALDLRYTGHRRWEGPVISFLTHRRASCGEGRAIVDDSVPTVECSRRSYSYMGRRAGDTVRVMPNPRGGRIVSVRPI